jgi:hypothetical protein
MIFSLRFLGTSLPGVWLSYAVFDFIRLIGVLYHHFYDGPLAKRNIEKETVSMLKVA